MHTGFLAAFQALQPGIEASVDALLAAHPGVPVAITGHSLGAAMSAHAAIALGVVKGIKLERTTYTFGQPRVGDKAFAVRMKRRGGWARQGGVGERGEMSTFVH